MSVSTPAKDPKRVRAGKLGMAARWGPPRTISLRDLPPEQRAYLAELVAVARRNLTPATAEQAEK